MTMVWPPSVGEGADMEDTMKTCTVKHGRSRRGRWAEYEARKRELQRRALSPTEYAAAVRALAKELRL